MKYYTLIIISFLFCICSFSEDPLTDSSKTYKVCYEEKGSIYLLNINYFFDSILIEKKILIKNMSVREFNISSDGSLLAFVIHLYPDTNKISGIYISDINGNSIRKIVDHTPFQNIRDLIFSPDNSKIAFTHDYCYHISWDEGKEFYVTDTSGQNLKSLFSTHNRYTTFSYEFSENSTNILFSGENQIQIFNLNGASPLLLGNGKNVHYLSNEINIAFQNENNPYDIYIMNSDGSDVHNLTMLADTLFIVESWKFPNNDNLLYLVLKNNYYITREPARLYMIKIDGSDNKLVYDGMSPNTNLSISSDGKKITFIDDQKVFIVNIDGSNKTELISTMDYSTLIFFIPN